MNLDEIVKSARSVIPGLTRNPEHNEITGFSFDFAPFDSAQDKQDGEPACSELVEPVEPRLSASLFAFGYAGQVAAAGMTDWEV